MMNLVERIEALEAQIEASKAHADKRINAIRREANQQAQVVEAGLLERLAPLVAEHKALKQQQRDADEQAARQAALQYRATAVRKRAMTPTTGGANAKRELRRWKQSHGEAAHGGD